MLIKREQMRLKQTHHATSSKKIKRPKTMKQINKINVQFVFGRERTERKVAKPADDWRRDAAVLRSMSLTHHSYI